MRDVRVLLILSAVLLAAFSLKSGHALPPPAVVPFVDLARYSGTWYEIAPSPIFSRKAVPPPLPPIPSCPAGSSRS